MVSRQPPRPHRQPASRRGFTLIELLVALSVIALLLSIAAPRYIGSVSRAEEAVLRENLYVMRDAIQKFRSDQGRYPAQLEELVQEKYLRGVPGDPLTGASTSWILLPPAGNPDGGIWDVRSGAKGTSRDGTAYSDW